MRNRVLMILAAAGALAAPGIAQMPGAVVAVQAPGPHGVAGQQAPQGGIGSLFDSMRATGGAGGFTRPRYKKARGPGHLAAKRIKRRQRNKLRAKGMFRKAVR